jgi:hypothetical protein
MKDKWGRAYHTAKRDKEKTANLLFQKRIIAFRFFI